MLFTSKKNDNDNRLEELLPILTFFQITAADSFITFGSTAHEQERTTEM